MPVPILVQSRTMETEEGLHFLRQQAVTSVRVKLVYGFPV
jgi:hypothetical protein